MTALLKPLWRQLQVGTPAGFWEGLISPTTEGEAFDVAAAVDRGEVWQDAARTTLAGDGDPVGSIRGELGRYYAEQDTSGNRPTLRTDGSRWWLESGGTQYMSFTRDTAPGGSATMVVGAKYDSFAASGRGVIGNYEAASNSGWGMDASGTPPNARFFYRQPNGATPIAQTAFGETEDAVWLGWNDGMQLNLSVTTATQQIDGSANGTQPPNDREIMFLMSWAQGSGMTGRWYCGSWIGRSLSMPERLIARQWAAARSVVTL